MTREIELLLELTRKDLRSRQIEDDGATLKDDWLWLLLRMKIGGQKGLGMTNNGGLSVRVGKMMAMTRFFLMTRIPCKYFRIFKREVEKINRNYIFFFFQ